MFRKIGFSNKGVGRKRKKIDGAANFDPGQQPGIENGKVAPLVDASQATKFSTGTGNWGTAGTWSPSGVPGIGDKVIIREGDTVTLDVTTAVLDWMRVDGTLTWTTAASTDIVLNVETIVVNGASANGVFNMGTVANPIPATSTAEVRFRDSGLIDLNYDPHLLSRGLISLNGETNVCGQFVEPFVEMTAATSAGATVLTFDVVPATWSVGDTVAIAPSRHQGHYYKFSATQWNGTESEYRTITAKTATTITVDSPLVYERRGCTFADTDNKMPRKTYYPHVANLTRNVKFTLAGVTATTIPARRAHTMIMGMNPPTDWRYCEFYGLGRTDKKFVEKTAEETVTSNLDNVAGRYVHHYHFLGTSKMAQKSPPILVGSTAHGPISTRETAQVTGADSNWSASPGWAFVQHASTGNWYNNAVFGAFGAAYVSEDGSEMGTWNENIAIWSNGQGDSNPKQNQNGKQFAGGYGFAAKGRMVRAVNNVAADCTTCFTNLTRKTEPFTTDDHQHPLLMTYASYPTTSASGPPINFWDYNTGYASKVGVFVVKASAIQGHDYWSLLEGNTMWNMVNSGYKVEYTAHYLFRDNYARGEDWEYSYHKGTNDKSSVGHGVGANSFDQHAVDGVYENFDVGVKMSNKISSNRTPWDNAQYASIGNSFADNTDNHGTDVLRGDVDAGTLIDIRYTIPATVTPTTTMSDPAYIVDTDGFGRMAKGDIGGTTETISDAIRDNKLVNETVGGVLVSYAERMAFDSKSQMDRFVSELGWWTIGGIEYIWLPFWLTDSLTGSREVVPLRIQIDTYIANGFGVDAGGTNHGVWSDALAAPSRDAITTSIDTSLNDTIDITPMVGGSIANAQGVLSSERTATCEVVQIGNTLTYRPDFGFTGDDTFAFWLWGNGKFTKVNCTVTVT